MHILIIEDNQELATTYQDIFLFARCEVKVAHSFHVARELLGSYSFDLIVSDATLEDVTIDDLFTALSHYLPGTRIVIISGSAEAESEAHHHEFGFLLKPVSTDKLLALTKRP